MCVNVHSFEKTCKCWDDDWDQLHCSLSVPLCLQAALAGKVLLHKLGLHRHIISFTNPLAAGSGLVERTPKKSTNLTLEAWSVKKYIAIGTLGTYSEPVMHEISKNKFHSQNLSQSIKDSPPPIWPLGNITWICTFLGVHSPASLFLAHIHIQQLMTLMMLVNPQNIKVYVDIQSSLLQISYFENLSMSLGVFGTWR